MVGVPVGADQVGERRARAELGALRLAVREVAGEAVLGEHAVLELAHPGDRLRRGHVLAADDHVELAGDARYAFERVDRLQRGKVGGHQLADVGDDLGLRAHAPAGDGEDGGDHEHPARGRDRRGEGAVAEAASCAPRAPAASRRAPAGAARLRGGAASRPRRAARAGRRRPRRGRGRAVESAARPAVTEIASAEMIPITRAKANSRTIGIGERTSERKPTEVASAAVRDHRAAAHGRDDGGGRRAARRSRLASRKRAWSWIA